MGRPGGAIQAPPSARTVIRCMPGASFSSALHRPFVARCIRVVIHSVASPISSTDSARGASMSSTTRNVSPSGADAPCSTASESTAPSVRVSKARMPPGVPFAPPNGRRAMRTPIASTGAKPRARRRSRSSRSAVPPTVAALVAAAPTSDSQPVIGCTTANEATVGSILGAGVSASLEIQVATGEVTDTSHVVGPVWKPSDAIPVAMSRRCRERVVRLLTSRVNPPTVGIVIASGSSIVRVWVVVRVARSTENPNENSIPDTFVITPASARLMAPTSTRRETVVSVSRRSRPPPTNGGIALPRMPAVGDAPFTEAWP